MAYVPTDDLKRMSNMLLNNAEIDLNAALQVMQNVFTPFDAEIYRIEFSRVSENGFEIVDAIDLVRII